VSNFLKLISTIFEFSRQNDMHFFAKIDILANQTLLSFVRLEFVENASF